MFTIEYATLEDMPSIMNIITESLPFIPDSDWFVGDTEEFYARHIADAGFILKAISNSDHRLAAFFIIRYPKLEDDNCGYDLSYTEPQLLQTAHMESCVVHPDYRGNHLESRLMSEAINILQTSHYHYLLGTVHPDNIPSVKAFLSNGFHIEKTLKKYGGKLRHIMYREL